MFSEKDPIIRLNKKTVLVLHWSDSYRCCQLYNPIQAESQQNTAEKPSNSFLTGSAGLYGVQSAELHNLFMNQVSVKTLLHTSNLNLFDSVVRKQKVLGFPTMRRIIFVGEPPGWNSFICRTAGQGLAVRPSDQGVTNYCIRRRRHNVSVKTLFPFVSKFARHFS